MAIVRQKWCVLVACVIAGMGIAYGVLPTARALLVARPPRKPFGVMPSDLGLTYETITFTTSSGSQVAAWYVPSRNDAVIIVVHGYGGNRADCLSEAQSLAEHGYGVLLLDLLAHGASGGDRLSLDGQEVLAAVAYLQTLAVDRPVRVAVWGFSLGGLVAIQSAAQAPAIQAVIADGPFPVATPQDMPAPETLADWLWRPFDVVQWQVLRLQGVWPAMSTFAALRQGQCPILLVSGMQTRGEYRVLRGYHATAHHRVELWEVPEAGHVESWDVCHEEYEARVLRFLEQIL